MKQIRFVPIEACNLQVREPQEGEQESRTIIGMPVLYNVRSVNLTPWSEDREVYEVLEAGFITPELLQRSDVVLNLNHSTKVTDILGRYRNSERDTLMLDLVAQGMACRCALPRTNNANDTLDSRLVTVFSLEHGTVHRLVRNSRVALNVLSTFEIRLLLAKEAFSVIL